MDNPVLTKQDKAIAGITLAHGTLGILWILWAVSQIGDPVVFIAANLTLAIAGIAAGLGWFHRKSWAAYLVMAFYLVQLVHVFTPSFLWSFNLGINFNIGCGWDEFGQLQLNLFALGMLIWTSSRAFAPNNSLKPTPLRGALGEGDASGVVPGEWRPDPTGRHQHRYWDGTGWTAYVADDGQASEDPFDELPEACPEQAHRADSQEALS
jgi:hypothetical protein